MSQRNPIEEIRQKEWVELYRMNNPAADRWAQGYGMIQHSIDTQARIFCDGRVVTYKEDSG